VGRPRVVVRPPETHVQTVPETDRTLRHRVNRPKPGTIRLWTIQPIEVWTALQREGVLYVEEALTPDLDGFRREYDWLREQARRRIRGYGGRYPWWAYDTKPDLRKHRFDAGPPGSRHVRLELAVTEEEVLLSDYGGWLYVLNAFYLPCATRGAAWLGEDDDDGWDTELDELGISSWVRPLPEPYQSRLEQSWERIFNTDGLRGTDNLQATFERLALEDVVAVTEFTTQARRDP